MKSILSRLNKIEEELNSLKISKVGGSRFEVMIERWRYDFEQKDIISFDDWVKYKEEQIARSNDKEKTGKELQELEGKIESQNGFMRIVFVNMSGKETN